MEKICFIVSSYFKYFKGGAELQAYFIAKQLAKNVEVHYLFRRPPNFNIKDFKKVDNGINLHIMRPYDYKTVGTFYLFNYPELIKLLNKIKPDIIYQRGGKPYIGMVEKWCKRNNKRSVFGMSMDSNCSKKTILNFKRNFLNYPSNILNSFFTFSGIRNANLLIAQTTRQQKLLQKNFNRDSIIIPNGLKVPLSPFKKDDPPIISWIANIKPLKQPEIFIKLAENLQDLNVQFVYLGRPNQGPYQNMLIEKTKKVKNLEYLGEIPFKETNELLSKSSLLVNTSTTEGFSNAYIQAWMRETPVVTLNCDPGDIIKNHKIGFHSGSFNQMVKDVRYLIENEDIIKEMGKNAREYAVKNHDIEKIGKQYLEVFRKLSC
jgi:glycosyltransferase involved in cell wall biosynthesis